ARRRTNKPNLRIRLRGHGRQHRRPCIIRKNLCLVQDEQLRRHATHVPASTSTEQQTRTVHHLDALLAVRLPDTLHTPTQVVKVLEQALDVTEPLKGGT